MTAVDKLKEILNSSTAGYWYATKSVDGRSFIVAMPYDAGYHHEETDKIVCMVSMEADEKLIAMSPYLARRELKAKELARVLKIALTNMDDGAMVALGSALADYEGVTE